MDAFSLNGLLTELRPLLVGRFLGQCRVAGAHALVCEIVREKDLQLWLDGGPVTAGFYLLPKAAARQATDTKAGQHRTRQAQLLFDRHLQGTRIDSLERIEGERMLVLRAGALLLSLRFSGTAPALTLAREGMALVTLGEGAPAWPLPDPATAREWHAVDLEALQASLEAEQEQGRAPARALLARCPPLGPSLAARYDGSLASLRALAADISHPRPFLAVPKALDALEDIDLSAPRRVHVAPLPLALPDGVDIGQNRWIDAFAMYLQLRQRGARFAAARQAALSAARVRLRRANQLAAHLAQDLKQLQDADELRRQAEALLACAQPLEREQGVVRVPDPREAQAVLRVPIDPRLTLPQNADRLFTRARRMEKARRTLEQRIAAALRAVQDREQDELHVVNAVRWADLPQAAPAPQARKDSVEEGAVRHYLTRRGLSVLVGRNVKDNHHLTFEVARPDDL
ncbi:MAG: NFACT family protein, partial [Vicinamibacteria bacterium]|nr:NFACT family protein [Vicinamibacteria bacterium]